MAHKSETGEKVDLREEMFVAYSNMNIIPNSYFSAAELCAALNKKGVMFEGYEFDAVLTSLVHEKRFGLRFMNGRLYLQVSS